MIPFDDEYSAGKRGKKPRSSKDGSWGLVLVFIVASSCAVYTRHRSLIFTATASATDPTPRVVLLEEEVKEPAVTVTHDGITYRTDAAAQAQAEATFNPTLHNMYKNLPPLQQMTEYLEKVGGCFKIHGKLTNSVVLFNEYEHFRVHQINGAHAHHHHNHYKTLEN